MNEGDDSEDKEREEGERERFKQHIMFSSREVKKEQERSSESSNELSTCMLRKMEAIQSGMEYEEGQNIGRERKQIDVEKYKQ